MSSTGSCSWGEGQPLRQKPFSGERPGEYYFLSPVHPGDTRFAVVYRLPYTGQANIQPAIGNPKERFVVKLPKSMVFEPTDPKIYQAMPGTTPDNVQGTAPVQPGSTVSFRISGSGMLAELKGSREQAKEIAGAPADLRERPGGGLGVPIDAPDPLKEHRWAILGGLALALVAGATVVVVRGRPIGEAKTRKEILHDASGRSQHARAQRRVAPRDRRRRRSSASRARAHG